MSHLPISSPDSAVGLYLYIKKSVRTCTCYSSHVLRPSHCPISRNEQRRPHADMYIHDQLLYLLLLQYNITTEYTKHIPWHLLLLCL